MLGRIACGRGLLEATSYILLPSANSPHRSANDARRSELSLTLARIVGSPTMSDMRRIAIRLIVLSPRWHDTCTTSHKRLRQRQEMP